MLFNMVVSIAVLALLLVSTVSAKSGFWSAEDLSSIQTHLDQLALKSTSNQEIFYSLQFLNNFNSKDKKAYCSNIVKAGNTASSAYDLYYALKNSESAGCDFSSKTASETAKSALSGHSLTEVVGGVLLSNHLKTLSKEDKENAASTLKSLVSSDGQVHFDDDSLKSLSNAHSILDVLVALRGDDSFADLTKEVVSAVEKLLPSRNSEGLTDATFLESLSQLNDKKVKLSASELNTVAEALFPLKYSDDATTVAKAYNSLARVRAYKAAPIFISQKQSIFKHDDVKNHVFTVEAVDVFGAPVKIDEVEVSSIKVSGKDIVFGEGLKSTDGKLDLSSQNFQSGRYLINLSASINGKQNPIKYQGYFVVTGTVSVEDVHIGVSDSKDVSKSDLSSVTKSNSFSGATGSAVGLDFVHVTYGVSTGTDKARKPHQSFVRFTHVESGYSVNFATKKSGEGSSLEYSLSLALGDEVERFNYLSGDYTISVLVGDATFAKPVEWLVGSITLKFPAKPVVNLPLYARSLLHTSDTTLTALPEIEHQMRPPAKRASNFMAGTFAILSLVPLVGLLGFILSLKPDLSKLRSLSGIAFVVCLGATLALYAGYWFALDGFSFYQTIKYLAFSLPVTLVVGKSALNSVTKLRKSKQV